MGMAVGVRGLKFFGGGWSRYLVLVGTDHTPAVYSLIPNSLRETLMMAGRT
jgi:hypothetical protein